MGNFLTVCALLIVGAVWGAALTYSHSLTFAELVCRTCRERNEAELKLNEEAPNGKTIYLRAPS